MRPGDLTSLSASDLLSLAISGQLRPLPLPRGTRWSEAQCMEFLDSILRNFPAGTLVLGRAAAPAAAVRIGPWSCAAAETPEAFWIVDGQQRLGALLDALSGSAPWLLELTTGALHQGVAEESLQGELPGLSTARALRLATLATPMALFDWLRLHPQEEPITRRLWAWCEGLRGYRFPVRLVSMEDPDILATICERANGARLDAVDRFSLRQGLKGEGAASLGKVARSLEGLGFGLLDDDAVLRALRALARGAEERGNLPVLLRSTEAALRRAIVFLQVNGGVPHESLLPYALPLAVLARFFHDFPRPQADTRDLLRQWFWRGSLGLTLGGHGERHLEAIQPGDEEGSARRLLALTPEQPSAEVHRLDRFHAAHARSRLQLCALASLRPRHTSGAPLDLAALLSTPGYLPPVVVETTGAALASGVSNRLLHPREGMMARALAAASPEVCASHGVTEEARQALQEGDTEGFLEHRGQALQALFSRYFARQGAAL